MLFPRYLYYAGALVAAEPFRLLPAVLFVPTAVCFCVWAFSFLPPAHAQTAHTVKKQHVTMTTTTTTTTKRAGANALTLFAGGTNSQRRMPPSG